MASFAVQHLGPGLDRIALAQPAHTPEPFDLPVNVYVLRGKHAVALVNCGHAAARRPLLEALASLGIRPAQVDRVVVTGIWPDLYGNADVFTGADIAVLAPIQRIGQALRADCADLRRRLLDAARQLVDVQPRHALVPETPRETSRVDRFVAEYLVPPPRNLRVLPLRAGQILNLAGHHFEVERAPGSVPSSLRLFEAARGWLFSADTVPASPWEAAWIHDARALNATLTEMHDLDARHLLPNRGPVPPRADAAIKRAVLYLNNFLTNAPFATDGAMSAPELVARDLGLGDEISVLYVALTLGYRALIEELIAEKLVDADDHSGLLARFGLEDGARR